MPPRMIASPRRPACPGCPKVGVIAVAKQPIQSQSAVDHRVVPTDVFSAVIAVIGSRDVLACVGQECVETEDGLHIWEDRFYPESILRPERYCRTAPKANLSSPP